LGGDLILVDRPGTNYDALKNKLEGTSNTNILCLDCDLEKQSERNDLIKELNEKNISLDVLINNAAFVGTSGLDGWACDFEEQSVDTWKRALEVNLTSVFDLSKGLAAKLKKSKQGSIINVASIYGVNGPDYSLYEGTSMGNPAAYAASKGGLIQLTRWLATTLSPDIRVNTISPGGVFRNQPESFVKKYEARTPLGRMATEKDFKGVIAYLASDLSAYTTGQNLIIDGGWTTW
jgi:NAD(P)-dependent dehydrogenase (short-subunit alcohol dehydrogenase family)